MGYTITDVVVTTETINQNNIPWQTRYSFSQTLQKLAWAIYLNSVSKFMPIVILWENIVAGSVYE